MKAGIASKRVRVTLASLSAAAVFWTGAAHASPMGEHSVTRTETVKYLPSALESTAGAAEFYAALKAAAERVCRDPEGFSDKSLKRDAMARTQCVQDALQEAVRRVDMPAVSYLHVDSGSARTAAVR